MFTIADGRDRLYQWDSDVKLFIDDKIASGVDEAHFTARYSRECLTVKVVHATGGSYVMVPNILLQKSYDIVVYAFCCTDKVTKFCYEIPVEARPKPTDYVYTETEVLSYKSLEDRVKALERDDVTLDDIEDAVKDYLERNPIEIPEIPEIPEAIDIDPTLSQEGAAADAKAVGDALAERAVKTLTINADNAPNTGENSISNIPIFTINYTPSDLKKHAENGGRVIIERYNRTYEMYSVTNESAKFRFIEVTDAQVDGYHAVLDTAKAVTITKTTHKSRMENTSGGAVGKIPRVKSLNSKGLPLTWEFVDITEALPVYNGEVASI